ncbi:MAG: hypothetical protein D6722_20235 [Bacteroidetes bacterium]|nr:MAG: hypothetical protein D6722_20235 [Bacteroidota bacterium]
MKEQADSKECAYKVAVILTLAHRGFLNGSFLAMNGHIGPTTCFRGLSSVGGHVPLQDGN